MFRSQGTQRWPAHQGPHLPLSAIRDPMHACACCRGSPRSPKGTTFASLPHSPARTPPTSSGDRNAGAREVPHVPSTDNSHPHRNGPPIPAHTSQCAACAITRRPQLLRSPCAHVPGGMRDHPAERAMLSPSCCCTAAAARLPCSAVPRWSSSSCARSPLLSCQSLASYAASPPRCQMAAQRSRRSAWTCACIHRTPCTHRHADRRRAAAAMAVAACRLLMRRPKSS